MSSDSEYSHDDLNKKQSNCFIQNNLLNNVKEESKKNDIEDNNSLNKNLLVKELDNTDSDGKDSLSNLKCTNNEKKIDFQISSSELQDFDMTQLNEFSNLDFVKQLIRHTRRRFYSFFYFRNKFYFLFRYDDIKKRIADLEKERNQEKEKLKKLFEVETQIEERLGFEFLQSSD